MPLNPMNALMNDFSNILTNTPVEDSVTKLIRAASASDPATAMLALCSLLMIENARRFHAEARYEELSREFKQYQDEQK